MRAAKAKDLAKMIPGVNIIPLVICASDGGDTSISGNNNNRGVFSFKRTIQE